VAGTLFVALGMVGFISTAWAPVLGLLCLAGAMNATGRSLQQPTTSALISKFSDPREQGIVFGLYHGLGSLARVVGPVVAGFSYEKLRHTGAFAVACGVAVLMALWTFLLRQPAPRPSSPEDAMGHAAMEAA
jgi:MFS transporter, DHA1 family, tetracycline resistance protein